MDLYRDFYEHTNLGYLTLDNRQVVRGINHMGLQLFSSDKYSLLGRSFIPFVEKGSLGDYKNLYSHVLDSGQHRTGRIRLVKIDGAIFDAEVTCRIHNRQATQRNFLMLVVGDISQYIAAERELHEANTTLKVLFQQLEAERAELEKSILSNIRQLIMPLLTKLGNTRLTEDQEQHLKLLRTSMEHVISPFLRRLSCSYNSLTSREIEITNLVREGYSTKEIGALLFISPRSVEFHKDHIRKKMGLRNKKINLRSHLLSLDM